MSTLLKPFSSSGVGLIDSPFGALQREINHLFSSFDRGGSASSALEFTPCTNVVETESEIKVSAELPGLEQKDVKVELDGDVLTISGEKKNEKEEKSEKRFMFERSFGSFARSMQLPVGVKFEDITALIQNGVLTVSVRKPAVQKVEPRKIEVKSAA